jgi:hypothetical protein
MPAVQVYVIIRYGLLSVRKYTVTVPVGMPAAVIHYYTKTGGVERYTARCLYF